MRKLFVYFLTLGLIASCKHEPKHTLNDDGLWDSIPQNFYIEPDTTVPQNFTDTVYGFRIWFPEKPIVEQDSMNDQQGLIVYRTYYVDYLDSFYVVNAVKYPANIFDQGIKPAEMLINAHNTAMRTQHLQSDFQALDTTSYDFPVLFFKVRGTRQYMCGMNMFYGNRMYQVFVVNTSHYPSQQTINRFLGSFQIVVKD